MRAIRGVYTTARATTTFCRRGPSEAISAMARMMAGKAISPSMTRIRTLSRVRKYPAASPTVSPATTDRRTTTPPTITEIRAP